MTTPRSSGRRTGRTVAGSWWRDVPRADDRRHPGTRTSDPAPASKPRGHCDPTESTPPRSVDLPEPRSLRTRRHARRHGDPTHRRHRVRRRRIRPGDRPPDRRVPRPHPGLAAILQASAFDRQTADARTGAEDAGNPDDTAAPFAPPQLSVWAADSDTAP